MQKHSRGFTLLELMLVMAIVAILAGVALPSMSSFITTGRISGAADVIKNEFEWARTEAVKDNDTIKITFITGANWCIGIDDTGGACDCSSASCTVNGQPKNISYADYDGLTLSTSGGLSSVTINPTGIADTSGAITFTDGSYSATLNLSVLGRASICSNTIVKYPQC